MYSVGMLIITISPSYCIRVTRVVSSKDWSVPTSNICRLLLSTQRFA